MNEIIRIYVHESQTPEALMKGLDIRIDAINYKQLRKFIRLYALCHFQMRSILAEEEGNLGGFGIGFLEKLTIEGYGTKSKDIKCKIQRETRRFYEKVNFPAGSIKKLEDLFVFGVDYGQDVVHECFWKGLDRQLTDFYIVPLK